VQRGGAMSKKIKYVILVGVVLVITTLIIAYRHPQQEQDIFAEVVILQGYINRNYRFIITNDKTLISLYGINHNRINLTEGDIMRSVLRARITTLTEQEFKRISEIVGLTLEESEQLSYFLSQWASFLVYDGEIYAAPLELLREIIQLSPIMTQYHNWMDWLSQ